MPDSSLETASTRIQPSAGNGGVLMDDQRFLESEWDYCLVLDACRYDVFEDVYDEYPSATNLEKRRSVGSSTPEWAYDVHRRPRHRLLLGTPFINDLGIPLNELKVGRELRLRVDRLRPHQRHHPRRLEDRLGRRSGYRPRRRASRRRIGTTSTPSSAPTGPCCTTCSRTRRTSRAGKGQKLKQIQKGIKRQEEEAENGDNDDGGGLLVVA